MLNPPAPSSNLQKCTHVKAELKNDSFASLLFVQFSESDDQETCAGSADKSENGKVNVS